MVIWNWNDKYVHIYSFSSLENRTRSQTKMDSTPVEQKGAKNTRGLNKEVHLLRHSHLPGLLIYSDQEI